MAKQKTNFFERHLEKGVFGATALVLVGVVVRFLVMSPNTASIGGQEARPGEIDRIVAAKAEQVRKAVQAAKPKEEDVPEPRKRWDESAGGALERLNLQATLIRTAPWQKQILDVGDVKLGAVGSDVMSLARVLPPAKPLVRSGRNLVVELPIQPLESPGARQAPAANMENGDRRDVNWATVFFTFDRQGQRQLFAEAGYSPVLRETVFGWPLIQRRKLSAGEWTEWEEVEVFEPYGRPAMPTIELDASGDAAATASVVVQDLAAMLRSVQARVIRPEFPPIVSGRRWEIPKPEGIDEKTFEGEGDARFTEELKFWDPTHVPIGDDARGGPWWIVDQQQVKRRQQEEKQQQLRDRQLEGKSPGQQDRLRATWDLKAARDLVDANDLEGALKLVEPWTKGGTLIPAPLRDQALDLRDEIEAKLKKEREAEQAQLRAEERRQAAMAEAGMAALAQGGGPPITILWAHDLTVQPGAVYQYRARLRLLNPCAARPSRVKDPNDATKLFIESDWSEPSDQVEIQPDVHFFLTASSGGNASVRIYKWFMGQWVRDDFPVEVGRKIGGIGRAKVAMLDTRTSRTMDVDFASDYVAVDLDFDRPTAASSGGSRRRAKTTTALIYLDPRNELRQRLHDEDKKSKLRKVLEEQVFKEASIAEDRGAGR